MSFIEVTLIEGPIMEPSYRYAKINPATVVGSRPIKAFEGSELLLAGLPPWSIRVKEDSALIAARVGWSMEGVGHADDGKERGK